MKLFPRFLVAIAGLLACAPALAASAGEIYAAKCSTCHDAGLASAPKAGDKREWARCNRNGTDALYESALKGKPNTAMLPKGGFSELTDSEVTAVVDYLLMRAGQSRKISSSGAKSENSATAADSSRNATAIVDDATLVTNIKTALAKNKSIVLKDIKVEAAGGVVTLRGVVDKAEQIKLAEGIAANTTGVRQVDNKLIPKDLFAWD